MTRKPYFVILFAAVIVFATGAVISPGQGVGNSEAVCEPTGPRKLSWAQTALAQGSEHSGCETDWLNQDGLDSVVVADPILDLKQSADKMFFSGKGFSANAGVEVSVRLLTQGTMSAPYVIFASTDGDGVFLSETMHVLCPNPDTKVYVVATDRFGVEHARIFEPGEFRC